MSQPSEEAPEQTKPSGPLSAWNRLPLYIRIFIGLAAGIAAGLLLEKRAAVLKLPATMILRVLGALASPLILIAVIQVLLHTELKRRVAGRLAWLLILNTMVAIMIGLAVANIVRPGERTTLKPPDKDAAAETKGADPLTQFLESVPKSLLGPLGDEGNVLGVIFIAVAFGLALRTVRERHVTKVGDLVDISYHALLVVLAWVVAWVPLGVFCIVADIVGTQGFQTFIALGAFVFAVLLGLFLQAGYYLIRVRFGCWVPPLLLLRGCRDALVMAFSTGSSTATMPVTFSNLKDKVGIRAESASLGALVGTNFNNDGTALYEAMSALFVSQMLVAQGVAQPLTLFQQFLVIVTSIIASVGAAGIPEAGTVTMKLVFTAVNLPPDYILLLLTVDWFLDRARTAINVMGDMNVSCMLDGHVRELHAAPAAAPASLPAPAASNAPAV